MIFSIFYVAACENPPQVPDYFGNPLLSDSRSLLLIPASISFRPASKSQLSWSENVRCGDEKEEVFINVGSQSSCKVQLTTVITRRTRCRSKSGNGQKGPGFGPVWISFANTSRRRTLNRAEGRVTSMNCGRCNSMWGDEAVYRVGTDILDLNVCGQCAKEARDLRLLVEPLSDARASTEKKVVPAAA